LGAACGDDGGMPCRGRKEEDARRGGAAEEDAAPPHPPLRERLDHLEQTVGTAIAGQTTAGVSVCQASIQERLHCVESLLMKSTEGHTREMRALRSIVERLEASSEGAREYAMCLGGEATEWHSRRFADLEQALRDYIERHSQDRAEALEQLISEALAQHAAELSHIREVCCQRSKAPAGAHTVGDARELLERVEAVERRVSEAMDRTAKDFAGLREAQGHQARALESAATSLEDRVENIEKHVRSRGDAYARESKALHALHEKQAAASERLDYLERLLGDSAAIHRKALKSLESTGAQLHALHASLPERLAVLEKRLGEATDRHAKQLKALAEAQKRQMDHMKGASQSHASFEGRLASVEQGAAEVAEALRDEIRAVRKAQERRTPEVPAPRSLGADGAALERRLASIEDFLGESADKHARVLEALRESQVKVSSVQTKQAKELEDLRSLGIELSALKVAHTSFSTEVRASLVQQLRAGERLDVLEQRLRSCFSS